MTTPKRIPSTAVVNEARALRVIKRIQGEIKGKYEAIHAVRTRWRDKCTHSQSEVFPWVHDDGNGQNSMREGSRCLLCGLENHYPKHPKGVWLRPDAWAGDVAV